APAEPTCGVALEAHPAARGERYPDPTCPAQEFSRTYVLASQGRAVQPIIQLLDAGSPARTAGARSATPQVMGARDGPAASLTWECHTVARVTPCGYGQRDHFHFSHERRVGPG